MTAHPENLQRSLFDELFPESTQTKTNQLNGRSTNLEIDDLTLLGFAKDVEGPTPSIGNKLHAAESVTVAPHRLWDLAILVLSRASKSLLETDFRRIAPRGHHIDDWKGPGDILKGEL